MGRVITNGHKRKIIAYLALPPSVQQTFTSAGASWDDYVKYQGIWYAIGDFEYAEDIEVYARNGWLLYGGEFGNIVIDYPLDSNGVVMSNYVIIGRWVEN